MPLNKNEDILNLLVAQMEKISDEDMDIKDIEKEATRSKQLVSLSNMAIQIRSLELNSAKFMVDNGLNLEQDSSFARNMISYDNKKR